MVDGMVGSGGFLPLCSWHHSIFFLTSSFSGSTWAANFKLDTEYSWPQKTFCKIHRKLVENNVKMM